MYASVTKQYNLAKVAISLAGKVTSSMPNAPNRIWDYLTSMLMMVVGKNWKKSDKTDEEKYNTTYITITMVTWCMLIYKIKSSSSVLQSQYSFGSDVKGAVIKM